VIDRAAEPACALSPPHLIDFLDAHRVGVLATVDKAAMPRQSVVYYVRKEQRLLISTESKRLKARDVRRSGWASLCVLGHERPYPSAVFSGPAEILTESNRPRDGRDRAAHRRPARAAGGAD
jgi:nitroimidazol reductase NimA-like FMN-containing flavoprotein (pyridoxamine 5'-phosphate oxidase superfamily)